MSKETKLKKWAEKALKGERGYEVVLCREKQWLCSSELFRGKINRMEMILWKDDHVLVRYFKDENNDMAEESSVMAVFKDDSKMLFFDGKDTVYSFGMETDSLQDIKMMFYYQVENAGVFVTASSQASEIKMFTYLKEEQTDALEHFILQIRKYLKEEVEIVESEVNKDATEC